MTERKYHCVRCGCEMEKESYDLLCDKCRSELDRDDKDSKAEGAVTRTVKSKSMEKANKIFKEGGCLYPCVVLEINDDEVKLNPVGTKSIFWAKGIWTRPYEKTQRRVQNI